MELLAARLDTLERTTSSLGLKLDRLCEFLDFRLGTLEKGLADSTVRHLRAVVLPLEEEVRSLREELKRSPVVPAQATASAPPAAEQVTEEEEEDDSEQYPNLSLTVCVLQCQSVEAYDSSQHGVTVEARARELVRNVKRRAHEQMAVWQRFCALSEDAEGSELPPWQQCRLYVADPSSRGSPPRLLEDRARLGSCRLNDGHQLLLVPSAGT